MIIDRLQDSRLKRKGGGHQLNLMQPVSVTITMLPETGTVSKVLTLPEIADLIESHEYNAELLVVHLAKHVNRLQHELYWELSGSENRTEI